MDFISSAKLLGTNASRPIDGLRRTHGRTTRQYGSGVLWIVDRSWQGRKLIAARAPDMTHLPALCIWQARTVCGNFQRGDGKRFDRRAISAGAEQDRLSNENYGNRRGASPRNVPEKAVVIASSEMLP